MIQARNDRQKTSSPEQESSLWSAYEEYTRGDRDLEHLDRIEEECEDVFLLNTSSHGLMGNLLNFVGGLFR
jgi:hypothetical protein